MRAKDLNVGDVKTIKDVYTLIDDNAFSLDRRWDFRDIWATFRSQTKSTSGKQKAKWELACIFFNFEEGNIFSQIFSSKVTPTLEQPQFDNKLTDYIIERAVESQNPLVKARYNHLLWRSPNYIKKNTYAIIAIENYLSAIQHYIDACNGNEYHEIASKILELFKNAVGLSGEIKVDTSSLKEVTKTLLFKTNRIESWVKIQILQKMLEYPKIFKVEDFKDTLQVFESLLKDANSVDLDFQMVNYYLPLAVKIAQKTSSDIKKWYNEIGLAYLRMAELETKTDRFWIKQDYFFKAIKAFQRASNTEKRKEVEKMYATLKPDVKLSKIRYTPDDTRQQEYRIYHNFIREYSARILKEHPYEIYTIIAGGFLFPKIKHLQNGIYQEEEFLKYAVQIRFDTNQNIVNNKLEPDKDNLYNSYKIFLNLSVLPYLHNIIIDGIGLGHLTFENFLTFLTDRTWLGKQYLKSNYEEGEEPLQLVALITPAIVEFFMQVKASKTKDGYKASYILCIDSLTLKIEGLFRAFCRMNGIATSVLKEKGMQEALIHEILKFEDLHKYFNDDDFLLFNYLFLNEGGMNLRNQVAHCFYDYGDYHEGHILLLIAALLRIAKFDYMPKV
ncbi:MAG: DUF4209 domain-containing protein [Spirosomaceae bacterium]|nr:DUF4209 domain-containing protein [Spirosomataceae bacterium]